MAAVGPECLRFRPDGLSACQPAVAAAPPSSVIAARVSTLAALTPTPSATTRGALGADLVEDGALLQADTLLRVREVPDDVADEAVAVRIAHDGSVEHAGLFEVVVGVRIWGPARLAAHRHAGVGGGRVRPSGSTASAPAAYPDGGMKTLTPPRPLVTNSGYAADRAAALGDVHAAIEEDALDAAVIDVVRAFLPLPHVFTLQCCHGHFLCEPGQDEHSLAPIPEGHTGPVRYRIAYVAYCLEDSARGRAFGEALARLTAVDPAHVQYGSADWFWEQWPNSYTLQVEPEEHRLKDQAVLTADEARRTQEVRDRFFSELRRVLAEEIRRQADVHPGDRAHHG